VSYKFPVNHASTYELTILWKEPDSVSQVALGFQQEETTSEDGKGKGKEHMAYISSATESSIPKPSVSSPKPSAEDSPNFGDISTYDLSAGAHDNDVNAEERAYVSAQQEMFDAEMEAEAEGYMAYGRERKNLAPRRSLADFVHNLGDDIEDVFPSVWQYPH
jgi:hypothetical protein